jgi:hypothetical protein
MNKANHLLTCLAEECAEVSHRICKAMRFGLEEIQPGQSLTNAQRIAEELDDLVAVIEMLEDEGLVPRTGTTQSIERKKAKVRSFMEYAEQCGALARSQ